MWGLGFRASGLGCEKKRVQGLGFGILSVWGGGGGTGLWGFGDPRMALGLWGPGDRVPAPFQVSGFGVKGGSQVLGERVGFRIQGSTEEFL